MKNLVFIAFIGSLLFSCTKENIQEVTVVESRASGRDVCAWVSSLKTSQKKETNLSYTVTVEYTIKNCTNIIPVSISLETTNTKTGMITTQNGLPFSGKINFTGLSVGDSFTYRVYTNASDTGELLDNQSINTVVIAK